MEQFVHILFTHAFVVLASSVQCFAQISLGKMQKRTQFLSIIGDSIIPVVSYQLLIQLLYQFPSQAGHYWHTAIPS